MKKKILKFFLDFFTLEPNPFLHCNCKYLLGYIFLPPLSYIVYFLYVRKKCLGLSDYYFPVLDLPLGINDPYRPFCLYSFLKTCLSNSQWTKNFTKNCKFPSLVRNSEFSTFFSILVPPILVPKFILSRIFLKTFFSLFYYFVNFLLTVMPCFKVKKNRRPLTAHQKLVKEIIVMC